MPRRRKGLGTGTPGGVAHCLLWDREATKLELPCQQQGLTAPQRWYPQEGLAAGVPRRRAPGSASPPIHTQVAARGTPRAWLQQGKGNRDGWGWGGKETIRQKDETKKQVGQEGRETSQQEQGHRCGGGSGQAVGG